MIKKIFCSCHWIFETTTMCRCWWRYLLHSRFLAQKKNSFYGLTLALGILVRDLGLVLAITGNVAASSVVKKIIIKKKTHEPFFFFVFLLVLCEHRFFFNIPFCFAFLWLMFVVVWGGEQGFILPAAFALRLRPRKYWTDHRFELIGVVITFLFGLMSLFLGTVITILNP